MHIHILKTHSARGCPREQNAGHVESKDIELEDKMGAEHQSNHVKMRNGLQNVGKKSCRRKDGTMADARVNLQKSSG